ncbi:MarR family winged helix-turn-helix transcriptional regulator, partial [Frankia sp. AvcI1]
GPQRMVDLVESLAMLPSTATRMCDRLDAKGLIRRARPRDDRRSVRLTLSPTGRQLVTDVTRRRREEIRRVLARVPTEAREDLIRSFRIHRPAPVCQSIHRHAGVDSGQRRRRELHGHGDAQRSAPTPQMQHQIVLRDSLHPGTHMRDALRHEIQPKISIS